MDIALPVAEAHDPTELRGEVYTVGDDAPPGTLSRLFALHPFRMLARTVTERLAPPGSAAEALDGLREVGRLRSMLDGIEAVFTADAARLDAAAVADREVPAVPDHGYPVAADDPGLNRSSLAAEIARSLRVSEKSAWHRLETARALDGALRETRAALCEGRITGRFARDLVKQTEGLPPESVREIQERTLPAAESATDRNAARRARRARERLHPESVADRRERARQARSLAWWAEEDGMATLRYHGPAEDVVAVYNTVDAHARALQGPGEARSLSHLRADTFRDALIDGWPDRPAPRSAAVAVTIPAIDAALHPDRACAELEGYGPIPLAAALKVAAAAPSLRRILTDPWDGAVLDVGRTSYRAPAALRDLARFRDIECAMVGCATRPAASELDHIRDWADGGATSLANQKWLCRRHQVFKHVLGWDYVHRPDGSVHWRTPNGLVCIEPGEATQPTALDQGVDPHTGELIDGELLDADHASGEAGGRAGAGGPRGETTVPGWDEDTGEWTGPGPEPVVHTVAGNAVPDDTVRRLLCLPPDGPLEGPDGTTDAGGPTGDGAGPLEGPDGATDSGGAVGGGAGPLEGPDGATDAGGAVGDGTAGPSEGPRPTGRGTGPRV